MPWVPFFVRNISWHSNVWKPRRQSNVSQFTMALECLYHIRLGFLKRGSTCRIWDYSSWFPFKCIWYDFFIDILADSCSEFTVRIIVMRGYVSGVPQGFRVWCWRAKGGIRGCRTGGWFFGCCGRYRHRDLFIRSVFIEDWSDIGRNWAVWKDWGLIEYRLSQCLGSLGSAILASCGEQEQGFSTVYPIPTYQSLILSYWDQYCMWRGHVYEYPWCPFLSISAKICVEPSWLEYMMILGYNIPLRRYLCLSGVNRSSIHLYTFRMTLQERELDSGNGSKDELVLLLLLCQTLNEEEVSRISKWGGQEGSFVAFQLLLFLL